MDRLIAFILDCLFPRACVNCERKGSLFCDTCKQALGNVPPWTPQHVAFTWYARRSVNRLIDAWKFQGDLSAEVVFQDRISALKEDLLKHWPWLGAGEAVLVPAPLTRRRYAERGFNQAERLANILGKIFDLPVEKVFMRTGPNVHLANLSGHLNRARALDTQRITTTFTPTTRVIIVDDVLTTGATLTKLADTLKAQGVADIYTLTLAQSHN